MSWFYSLKEGASALRTSKQSSVLPIVTVGISLFFVGFFAFAIVKGSNLVGYFKSQLTMELFLRDGITEETTAEIQSQLIKYPEIAQLRFISKEQALEEVNQEFGSNIESVLGENPLPSSFRILLKSEYQEEEIIEKVKSQIETISGIDEVVYRFDLQKLILKYIRAAILFVLVIGSILVVSSIILISNTVKLSILTRKDSIEIMSLIGAKQSFIRGPFLIEGALQGLIGAILAILGNTILVNIIKIFFPQLMMDNKYLALSILFFGVLFGGLGSWLAIRKTLR